MKIIQAQPEHLKRIAPLFHQYRSFYRQEKDEENVNRFLKERLTNKDTIIFLALHESNDAAGFVHLFPIFSSVSLRSHWLLNDLFVHPDFRRQGLGEALLKHAQEFARSTNAKGLLLQTEISNTTAQSLYLRMGFQKDTTSYFYEWLAS